MKIVKSIEQNHLVLKMIEVEAPTATIYLTVLEKHDETIKHKTSLLIEDALEVFDKMTQEMKTIEIPLH